MPKPSKQLADLIARVEALEKAIIGTTEKPDDLASLIAKCGFNYVSKNINATNFPPDGKLSEKVKIIHLNRPARTDEVLAEIKKKGMRPATLRELLMLCVKDMKLGTRFSIAAPGSLWTSPGGGRLVPCLDRYGGERGLRLHWDYPMNPWREDYRFAAVKL